MPTLQACCASFSEVGQENVSRQMKIRDVISRVEERGLEVGETAR
jgi:hypothetical protein